MSKNHDKDDVSTALSLLLDTLGEQRQRLNEEVAKAMESNEYNTATAVIEFAERLSAFQEDVRFLGNKWQELENIRDAATPIVRGIVSSSIFSDNFALQAKMARRTRKAILTESELHCFHILAVLESKGGKAKNKDVTDAVNKMVKMLYPKFKQARVMLVQKRWVKKIGSSQVLEISGSGRSWLLKQQAKNQPVIPAFTRLADISKPALECEQPNEGRLYVTPEAMAIRRQRLQNAENYTNFIPPGKAEVPDHFTIKRGWVVRAGDWIEDEILGFGKIIKVNSNHQYTPQSDCHEVWFFNGKQEIRMKNHALKRSTRRLVPVFEIPEPILEIAPEID